MRYVIGLTIAATAAVTIFLAVQYFGKQKAKASQSQAVVTPEPALAPVVEAPKQPAVAESPAPQPPKPVLKAARKKPRAAPPKIALQPAQPVAVPVKAPVQMKVVAPPQPAPVMAVAPEPVVVPPPQPAPVVAVAPEQIVAPQVSLAQPAPKVEETPTLAPSVASLKNADPKALLVLPGSNDDEERRDDLFSKSSTTSTVSVSSYRGAEFEELAAKISRHDDLQQAVAAISQDIRLQTKIDKLVAFGEIAAIDAETIEKHLGEISTELLATETVKNGSVRVLERGQMNEALQELRMSSLGLTKTKNALKVGLILGVDYVVSGSVSEDEGTDAILAVTQVDVSTGRKIGVWEAHFPAMSSQPLLDRFVEKRSRFDPVWRSALIPGWGQYYNEQNVKGGLFLGLGFGLVGLTAFEYTRFNAAHDDYLAATSESQASTALGRQQTIQSQVYGLAAVTAAFWIFNGLDAYLYSSDESRVNVESASTSQGGYSFNLAWRP